MLRFATERDRSVRAVPVPVVLALIVALALHMTVRALAPPPSATAAALPSAPAPVAVRVASLDEPVAAAQFLTLYLQAFDNQPGVSVPFRELDYGRVAAWLESILTLDSRTQYPLLMASHLYAQVPDQVRQRLMLDFVHRKFIDDPGRRWRWLAHATLIAKHRLNDHGLALRYARELARLAPQAPGWARQMHIFILEDMGEVQSAAIVLGGLLAAGEVSDPRELYFLTQRLEEMKKSAENSAKSSN
jgi:hypothetical protein